MHRDKVINELAALLDAATPEELMAAVALNPNFELKKNKRSGRVSVVYTVPNKIQAPAKPRRRRASPKSAGILGL